MKSSLTRRVFLSPLPGPKLLVLGAIHGDEICGTIAIGRLIAELEAGIVTLARGSLTCVPICNPEAYARAQRCVAHNLNRIITQHAEPQDDEHHHANEVAALIDDCDMLLDLHSYTSGEKPFTFLDKEDADHRAYAAALGVADWVAGWNEAYGAQDDITSNDTVSYAQRQGKVAMLVECGTHTDPAAAAIGYQCLRAALGHFGLTEPYPVSDTPPRIHRMHTVVTKPQPGDFVRDWKHLDPIKAGEEIARYDTGDVLRAPGDGVVLLPVRTAAVGEEWIYFGHAE